MRIREENTWHAADVRAFCIDHNYYTCGDCDAYANMLDMVSNLPVTPENLYKVAFDILVHSGRDNTVENIMFQIRREVVLTFYEIEEL